jgi:zinc transporter ZupT
MDFGGDLSPGMLASIAAAAVSAAGLLSLAAFGDWGRRNSPAFSAFAIGILSVAVLFHLIPEAIDGAPGAWKSVLVGGIGMLLIGGVLRFALDGRSSTANLAFGFASIIALGFHSFLDGVIYEATYHSDPFTGIISTAGLLLHEFPEGVIAFYLAREAQLKTLTAGIAAFVASSLTTIAGALAGSVIIENYEGLSLDHLLAVAAGALAYVIIFHLGPHARLAPGNRGYQLAAVGVIIATLAEIFRHAGH